MPNFYNCHVHGVRKGKMMLLYVSLSPSTERFCVIGFFLLSCSWATHSSSGWNDETSTVHHHVWWGYADLMIKKLILMNLLSPFVLWIGRALLVQLGPKIWLGVFLVLLQVDEGWIRRSVLCGFKGVKRRCVMTSLTLNTMNPIGEEESCSSLGELLLLSQRFSSLVEISSYPEDFLFIFEGVSHLICTSPVCIHCHK